MEPADRCVHGMVRANCAYCRRSRPTSNGHRHTTPASRTPFAGQIPPRPSSQPAPPPRPTADPTPPHNGAASPPPPPRFAVGDIVAVRSETGRTGAIRSLLQTEIGYSYELFFSANDRLHYMEDSLEMARLAQPEGFLSHRDFLRDLLLVKLRSNLSDSLYSFRASRTQFLVYQFKPLLKLLNSPEQRILIADEVGLGKTIEAGIIYLELKARLNLQRVLVVCPSGLKQKWHDELRSRFDEEFAIQDAATFKEFLKSYERFGGREPLKGIISLETLRREALTGELARLRVQFDLVIVDEAHHLRNATTLAHAMGEILADQSDAFVLLTATPLQTGNDNLFHLMQLISPGEFDTLANFEERIRPNQHVNAAAQLVARGEPASALAELRKVERTTMARAFRSNPCYEETLERLSQGHPLGTQEVVGIQRSLLELNTLSRVFNRTRKREVSDAAVRCAHKIEVEFTPAERAFYDGVVEMVRQQVGHFGQNVPIFAVIMKERQAASCIQALRLQMQKALTTHRLRLRMEESSSEIEPEDGDAEKIGPGERPTIESLLRLCQQLGTTDTKFDLFLSSLRSVLAEDSTCKVLVFSFFRDTLDYLKNRLAAAGLTVGIIHGGIPVEERHQRIAQFREDPSIAVMLASEVGAEGLDFQFCGAMFNYDLPWNPMKVEQRIGRLDRYGQHHQKIQIYNLVIAGTIETRIFWRLYERIRLFESSIGELEAILGEEVKQLSRDIFMNRLTREQEVQKAEQAALRLERQRQNMEQFEEQRHSLMGHDDLFEQEMGQMLESGRFISPDEVRALVSSYLEEASPGSRLIPKSTDGLYSVTPNGVLIQQLSAFAAGNPRHRQQTERILRHLRPGEAITCSFDPDAAQAQKSVEFITVHHPLALAAAHHFRQRQIQNPPRSVIQIAAPGGITGDYAFFLFRLLISGITPTSTLVPVLVELNSGLVLPEAPAAFLLEVQSIRSAPPPEVAFDEGRFATLQEAAQIRMARVTRARQGEAQQRNDAVVEARLGAMEQSIGFRIRRAEEQLEEARDPRIQRMRQSQIENLREQFQARKEELEEKRRLNVGAGLVACGLVRLDPSLQPVAVSLQGFTWADEPRRATPTPQPSIAPASAPRVPELQTPPPSGQPAIRPAPSAPRTPPRLDPPRPASQPPIRRSAPEEPKPSILDRIRRWFR